MKKIFKFLLITLLFSYYFVAIALNFPWINAHLDPLTLLGKQKIVTVKQHVYLGTYPDAKRLKILKSKYGIEQVVVLLDPNFPLSRGLVRAEKKICRQAHIDFVIVPISYFSSNVMDYVIIKSIVEESDKPTYINAYTFDKRMRILKNVLK